MTKDRLRIMMVRRLKQQEEDERRRKSQAIQGRLFRLAAFRRASMIGCYVGLPYEVQTWQMIEQMLANGKRVAVPWVQSRTKRLMWSEVHDPSADLAPGAFRVWEPRPSARRAVRAEALDLMIVPGLAFDGRGHRLGHGSGYFDRFLARLARTIPTIGLAFRFQLLNRLPIAAHDYAVQTVLTA